MPQPTSIKEAIELCAQLQMKGCSDEEIASGLISCGMVHVARSGMTKEQAYELVVDMLRMTFDVHFKQHKH